MNAVEARKLRLAFPAPGARGLLGRRREAVRGVDVFAAAGETCALAGENGAGKSTTLRLLAGALVPDSGEALLGGVPAARRSARVGLGFVGETPRFPPGLSVRETLAFFAALAGASRRESRDLADRAARRFGIWGELGARAARTSRGTKRRIALAAALIAPPRFLVLDEPFSGLDAVARRTALREIRKAAAAGAAVVLSLHRAEDVEEIADRLVVLREGRVAATGTPAAVRSGLGRGGTGDGRDWLAAALRRAGGEATGP